MATLRVTQGLLIQRIITNLNNQTRRILEAQDQLASGLSVTTPSDDPIAARRGINTRTAIAKNDQYLSNMQSAAPQLSEAETSIRTTLNNILRAHELTLQGASGTNAQPQLEAIAEEINQILEAVLVGANHQTGGRHIFAGTRTLNPAYIATRNAQGEITAVTYDGNNENIQLAISDGIKVNTNETGPAVFQAGQDIFQLLINIRDELRAGNQASLQNTRLAELETAREQLLRAVARIGAVQNRLDRATENTEDLTVQFQELLSDTLDADFAEVVVTLNARTNAYEAALTAAARVIQPSLLDFIR